MKIYTKSGDRGQTGLLSGERVWKNDLLVEAYGTLDELVSVLGLVRALLPEHDRHGGLLVTVQEDLWITAAQLASRPSFWPKLIRTVDEERIAFLEEWIDRTAAAYGQPDSFVLPGHSLKSSAFHLARTVCRRAERAVVSVAADEADYDYIIRYFNRLSDLFFILAWAQDVSDTIAKVMGDLGYPTVLAGGSV